MWDPFSYTGPKSAARLEDERYVRALQMRDDGVLVKDIAERMGFVYSTLRQRFMLIDHEMEKA